MARRTMYIEVEYDDAEISETKVADKLGALVEGLEAMSSVYIKSLSESELSHFTFQIVLGIRCSHCKKMTRG